MGRDEFTAMSDSQDAEGPVKQKTQAPVPHADLSRAAIEHLARDLGHADFLRLSRASRAQDYPGRQAAGA